MASVIQYSTFMVSMVSSFLIQDVNHVCVNNCSALNVYFGPGSWDE